MTRRLDYSKWDHIEVSDDEDDTHPNIDTPSLFRWRHQARVERMEDAKKEKDEFMKKKKEFQQEVTQVKEILTKEEKAAQEKKELEAKLAELQRKSEQIKKEEEELKKKERLTPWNVDTLSKPGFEKTIINKDMDPKELSEEEKHKQMMTFVEKYESEIKHFGLLKDYNESRDYLRDHSYLACDDTCGYLTLWCVNLEVQEKTSLMKRVAHQAIVMQYIMELSKQLKRDPRSCVPGFFDRIKTAEKQYTDAFEDELQAFIERVQGRAKVRLEEARKEAEEEERQKRLGPGGLDPLEVLETLPADLKECFETQSVGKLQGALAKMSKEDAAYHMKRCVDSGLWVPDARSKGLTAAKDQQDWQHEESEEGEEGGVSDEEAYEKIDEKATPDAGAGLD